LRTAGFDGVWTKRGPTAPRGARAEAFRFPAFAGRQTLSAGSGSTSH
jgi:hypothetical protein